MDAKIQYSGTVKCLTVELRLTDKSQWQRLRELSDHCREVANAIWKTWLIGHVQRGTPARLREHLAAVKAWDAAGKQGDKPKLTMQAVDKELASVMYHTVAAECPMLARHPLTLAINTIVGKIKERKAANGSLPGWWAILLNRESLPSATHAQPIPFDRQDSQLLEPTTEAGWRLRCKVHRTEQDGKGVVADDWFDLVAGTYQTRSVTVILQRIVSGEYKFCGSSLVYSKARRKWFAHLAYQRREAVAMRAGEGTAFLRPGYYSPWRLRIDGRSSRRRGDGRYVREIRRQLLTQRWSRQQNYRYAGSSTKGHGRTRALAGIEKLSQRWRDFVRTDNRQMAAQIVRECVSRNIRTLVFFQPTGQMRDNRFLTVTGKVKGKEDPTGWDWYGARKAVAEECQEHGIHFIARASGEVDRQAKQVNPAKKAGSKKRANAVARKAVANA